MEPRKFQAGLMRTEPTEEDRQNQLLLLELQLLQKNLKLPYAVVKPRQQPPKQSGKDEEPASDLVKNRKRKRSEEPNGEDKREKRKLMNRVSAQNARDRKRLYLESLEKKVAELEKQNHLLTAENSQLKIQSSVLETEKKQLEMKLTRSDKAVGVSMATKQREDLGCTVRSAVPIVSLQQKHTSVTPLVYQSWLTLSIVSWMTSLQNWQEEMPDFKTVSHFILSQTRSRLLANLTPEMMVLINWWGAHQSSWNPPMN